MSAPINNLLIYDTIKDLLQTGDLLVFSGKGRSSNLIKHFSGSRWSHVGLVAKIQIPPLTEPRLFVMESTTLNDVPDVDGRFKKGVQLVLLSQRLATYSGEVYVKQLKAPLTQEQEIKMLGWLFQKYNSNTEYDTSQAIGAAVDRDSKNKLARVFGSLFGFNNKEDFEKLFCSELACQAYIEAGLVDPSVNASEMLPEDVYKFDFLKDEVRII